MPQSDVSTQRNNGKWQARSTRWWGVEAAALVTSRNKIDTLSPKTKTKQKTKTKVNKGHERNKVNPRL